MLPARVRGALLGALGYDLLDGYAAASGVPLEVTEEAKSCGGIGKDLGTARGAHRAPPRKIVGLRGEMRAANPGADHPAL